MSVWKGALLTCWQTAHRTMLAKVRAAAGDFGLGGYLYLEKGVRQEIAVMCHSDCPNNMCTLGKSVHKLLVNL